MASLADYRDRHEGAHIVVCGCGPSLNDLEEPDDFFTIGVNDVGRSFTPDYLVVVNPRSQFRDDRFRYVEESDARALFTQLELGVDHPTVVRFRLGRFAGTDLSDPGVLHYTQNSPYVAVCLAAHMGARRIGLLGVDLTRDHFFGATGPHPLTRRLKEIDRQYRALAAALEKRGVELLNLSDRSRLTSLRRADPEDFRGWPARAVRPGRGDRPGDARDGGGEAKEDATETDRPTGARSGPDRSEGGRRAGRGLRVVHVAATNCAGSIWNLHDVLRRYGGVESRVVTASDVTNGLRYPRDLLLSQRDAVRDVLERADLVHFHNFVDARSPEVTPYRSVLDDKPALLQFHSEPEVLRPRFPGRDPVSRTDVVTAVVAQKQARFLPRAVPVPNALDIHDPPLTPGRPPTGPLRVVYTPTDTGTYPDPRATCRGKGYPETRRILRKLAEAGLVVPVIRTSVPWRELMEERRASHAVIDECVTGGYHLTSLEALAQGLATLAYLDSRTRSLLVGLTGSPAAELPWLDVSIDDLESELAKLARDPERAKALGRRSRSWMERYWSPEWIAERYLGLYARVLDGSDVSVPVSGSGTAAAGPDPVDDADDRPRPVEYGLPGLRRPRRSEEFAQQIRIGRELLELKGSLEGGAVHILGNGPSVDEPDLSLLAERTVIGVNSAPLLRPRLGGPADFYCVSDRRFLESPEGRGQAEDADGSIRVFAGYCHGFLAGPDIHYVRIVGGDGVSADLVRGVYHGCSVVLFAAQLALWLGARHLLFHGCEFDYGEGRFHDEEERRPHDRGTYPRIRSNFEALVRHLRGRGGTVTVVGPSRLTGHFGASAVAGIRSLPVDGLAARLRAEEAPPAAEAS